MSDSEVSSETLRSHLSFSLLTLVMLTTIVAMGLVIVSLYREVLPLRREIRRLRSEVGELTIDDPTKFYIIRIPTASTREWAWRVYVPQGEYCFQAANSAVKQGVPEAEMFYSVGAVVTGEESIVRAVIRNGELFVNVAGESVRMLRLHQSYQEQLDGLMGSVDHSIDIVAGDFGQQEELERGSDLVLLQASNLLARKEGEPSGFTLWIGPDNSGLNLTIK